MPSDHTIAYGIVYIAIILAGAGTLSLARCARSR